MSENRAGQRESLTGRYGRRTPRIAAYQSGTCVAGAIIVAIIAGGLTLTIGQIALATV